MALEPKQQAFCEEYIIDFNGTQAAIRAGYSERTAGSIASENLQKPEIQAEIQRQIENRSKRTEITQDRVLLEIARLAFNDPRKAFDANDNLLPVHQWPDDVAAAISSIKVTEVRPKNADDEEKTETYLKEIKFWDKGKQIELAGKHLAMFSDKVTLAGDKDNPLMLNIDAKAKAAKVLGLLALQKATDAG
jgi:phage terminase small subunit